MRRAGGLWAEVTAFCGLVRAAHRAARGKRAAHATASFLDRLEPEVLGLQRALRDGTWRPGPTRSFVIHDPKRRTITAIPFADRVVHHALMAPLEPVFERRLGPRTHACRKGLGMHTALASARRLVRSRRYSLRLDIAGFFASLRHEVVLDTLRRLVKDGAVLDLVRTILAGPERTPLARGRGLPIGSLTSQWLANVTLGRLDAFVVRELGIRDYVRYMDDGALFCDDKATLRAAHAAIAAFVRDELALSLKERATRLAPTAEGMPWLGFLVLSGTVRLRGSTRRRLLWRLRFLRWRLAQGDVEPETFRRAVAAVLAHMQHADTLRLRQSLFSGSR